MANTSLHIKRIQQELKDFLQNPSDTFHAEPLKEEIHIWHFTIKGPTATEFEGGIYHGKIELPFDYPLKPPAIYFLTPSGRYETNTKICLTITDYHPEHWNPGWTIKTMLKALISYFPEKEGTTSVGALEYTAEERKKLAQLSRKWVCPTCGPIIGIIKEREEEKKEEETDNKVGKEGEQKAGASEDEVPVEEADVRQAEEVEEEVIENEGDKKEKQREDPFGDHFVRKEIDIQEKEKNRERERERERKREERRSSSQHIREDRDRSEIEIDLKMLETSLLQHILYYEAKQSIRYQRNLLNPEKPQQEAAGEEERKEAASATVKSATAEKSFEESIGATDYKAEEENEELLQEQNKKEAEKQRIKQQITYINVLIAVMLVGIVAVIIAV